MYPISLHESNNTVQRRIAIFLFYSISFSYINIQIDTYTLKVSTFSLCIKLPEHRINFSLTFRLIKMHLALKFQHNHSRIGDKNLLGITLAD